MIKPEPNIDTLVLLEEIDFDIEDAPAINFKTMQLDPFSRFHYIVKLYKKSSGEKYYLFSHCEDCTLFIMNCNKSIYDILAKIIPIDDIEIFEHSAGDKKLEFVPIPDSYRHQDGPSGMPVIFTD